MMSALGGGRGSPKSGHSKGGRVTSILHISTKCGQRGERGSKLQHFCRRHLCMTLYPIHSPRNWQGERRPRHFLSATPYLFALSPSPSPFTSSICFPPRSSCSSRDTLKGAPSSLVRLFKPQQHLHTQFHSESRSDIQTDRIEGS